ncbi:hypothetical protein [Brevundimonas sp.]|uniref:hypothetical protein n=1 Tax=Brevundimonas sp. TaxID=1871086 RepID=UPI0028A1C315|nr:hypothetical protein [Brevundimonas sp.]
MAGISGGWLTWIAIIGLSMTALCFLISLATRRFLSGAILVLVTTALALLLVLLGFMAGMAKSDFRLVFVLPYALLALAIAGTWLLGMKARAHRK